MEYIGARQMYVVDSGVNVYAHDVETYEEMLRDLKDSLVKDRLPQIYFCNAGTRMAQSDFEQGRLFASEVFVFVDREFVPEQLTATVPAGNYACIYCDDFYKEQEYIARLREYIRQSRCRVCGGLFVRIYCRHPRGRAKRPRAVPAAAGACAVL